MDNKDFFDQEFDKMQSKKADEQQASRQSDAFNNWSNHTPQPSAATSKNKSLYITLLCLALVLCIVLGWTLCAIFTGIQNRQRGVLDEVFKVLDNEYYKKVDDVDMWKGIEAAGTALLQNAGDQFSRLMSPSTYYKYNNPTSSIGADSKGVFGMSFQIVEGLGLYVSSVTPNSNAYGVLQGGDFIVKIYNLNDGKGVTLGKDTYYEINLTELDADTVKAILDETDSADFNILRDGAVFQTYLQRGVLSYPNNKYPFEFVEFYFGDNNTNVTLGHGSDGAQTSVMEERLLNRLSQIPNTGYIRIDQFMSTDTINGETDAYSEFKIAMDLFKKLGLKHLILDLKGNPGGSVYTVCDIAGMLATDSKLTVSQQKKLRDRNGDLLITTLVSRYLGEMTYSAKCVYGEYFGALGSKPDIVIWTDGGSASASELLTGALLDYGTAVQMGTRTYGKGIAQTEKKLNNYTGTFEVDGKRITENWVVYYTVAEYFSPVTKTNIHGKGYKPAEKCDNLSTYDDLWTATKNYFNP